MNPEELWETTLNPENNTLLKVNYSGNDVDNETTNPGDRDREIFKILMGEDVVPRKDGLITNDITPSKAELTRRMGDGILTYTKTEDGRFIPVWSESI